MTERSATHQMLSDELTRLSQPELSDLIAQASPVHSGVGGNSALVKILNLPVFVKRVPLTDLERRPENLLATANLFELPMFFQYRLGSHGFGAWREVVTHQMTTEWVLTGQCLSFPLLHHWRVLPATRPEPIHQAELVRFWGNSGAVGARLEALQNASACVALFLEYIPQNLYQWLSDRLAQGGQTAESAVEFVDRNLRVTNAFMQAQGLTHFDAHFENILCDGERLYFSDFGLALSAQFDLTRTEREFLVNHCNFDRCNSALSLIISLLGGAGWEVRLREYLQGGGERMPASIHAIVLRDAAVALALKEFFGRLHHNKGSVYPADSLAALLCGAETSVALDRTSGWSDIASPVMPSSSFPMLKVSKICQEFPGPRELNRAMSTAQRLNQLMDWVRSDRSRTNLESAAEWTGYSRFHLHRLFKEHTGETLQEFSSRNRLARAAQLLRQPRQNILQVALECGFSSAEDFSRSFRRRFGLTPREAARGERISLNRPAPGRPPDTRWPVYLQTLPPLEIYYRRVFRAMSNPEEVQHALRQLYDCSAGPLIGLCWDDMDVSPLRQFIYDAGILENRSWLNRLHLPARTYVVMDFQGNLGDEAEAFEYLRHSWLPRHNCRPAAGPSLEIFVDERSLGDWDRLNLKLCIPLSE